jgi:hypothetical protein
VPMQPLMTMDNRPAAATADVRCPSCGARNVSAAAWCSLCFAAMNGSAGPAPAERAPADPQAAGRQDEPPTQDGAEHDPGVDSLLAELAARERPTSRLSALGPLLSSPGARVTVMFAGAVLVAALGFGLMAALGSLL